MKKNIYKFILVLALSLLFADKSFAATSDVLPQMLVGQASASVNGMKIYGGMTGNYAVYNPDSTASYGFQGASFTNDSCTASVLTTLPDVLCFILGTGDTGAESAGKNSRLMTSRTLVDIGDGRGSLPIYELPALFMGTNIVIGDTFGTTDLSKFSFWGNNMSTTTEVNETDALWNLKSYDTNPGSQSAWVDALGKDTPAFTQYYDKITKLANNGKVLKPSDTAHLNQDGNIDIYLQNADIKSNADSEAELYPEGKTWIVDATSYSDSNGGDLKISNANGEKKTITYHGVGTILVKGNISVDSNVEIVPFSDKDKLGIISIAGD